MKTFKIIDVWLSIGLIISITVLIMIDSEIGFMENTLLTGYFVVGGWHVISMLVHAFNHCFTYKNGARYIYHWITLISLATMPLGSFWILGITAPFMAVFYTWLCYRETYIKMKRPLDILK
jgi:hypothetical protein